MRLTTLEIGSGPRRTALVHGFLGSGRNLAGLARLWAARDPTRSFVLPDLAGHGTSPPLPPGADLHSLARDLLDTLAGADPVEVVGHSLGGRVALAAAQLAPERLSRVTLLDIAPGPIPLVISESARVLDALADAPVTAADRETMRRSLAPANLTPALVEWMLTNLRAGGDGYVWRIDVKALTEAAPRMNGADLWPVVEARRVPLRAIRGGRSPYVTDADVRRFEADGCPVTTLAGAGHFVHVDAPDALVAALLREEG